MRCVTIMGKNDNLLENSSGWRGVAAAYTTSGQLAYKGKEEVLFCFVFFCLFF